MADHIRPAAVRARITKRLGWHTLRHTFGTLIKSQGADVATTQALLRHANVSVTMDRYVQAVTPAKREAQSRIVASIPFPNVPREHESESRTLCVVPFPEKVRESDSFPNVPGRLTDSAATA